MAGPLRGREGVVVAARAGGADGDELRAGDVIYSVNGVSVRGSRSCAPPSREAAQGQPLVLHVERAGARGLRGDQKTSRQLPGCDAAPADDQLRRVAEAGVHSRGAKGVMGVRQQHPSRTGVSCSRSACGRVVGGQVERLRSWIVERIRCSLRAGVVRVDHQVRLRHPRLRAVASAGTPRRPGSREQAPPVVRRQPHEPLVERLLPPSPETRDVTASS